MSVEPEWSRRWFLTARGLGASTGGLIAALIPKPPRRARPAGKSYNHWSISRRAMGCDFTVMIPPSQADPMTAGEAALDVIGEMDDLLTIYRGDSAMSRLNQEAADGPVRVNYQLYEVLKRAAELSQQTGGAFDAASGALVKAWGFFRGPRRVPTEAERLSALACSGMRHVLFDDETVGVQYKVRGLEINLGSIGKGYGIDRALDRIRTDFGIPCALIQGGTSSMRAIGSPAGDDRGWLIAVDNPFKPGQPVATVCLRDRALATTSTSNQHFEAGGQRYGHVIDPRTGWPADALGSATVLAPDAATADALSTALFVMGLDKAADFCHNHSQIAALLVLKHSEADDPDLSPRVVTFNLPPEDVNLTPGSDPPGL